MTKIKRSTVIFATITLIIIGSRVYVVFFLPNIFNNTLKPNFGDLVSSLGTLFSGLAFLGLIYTAYLQQQELGLQREELKLTREELQKSAEAQKESAKNLLLTAEINALSAKLNYQGSLKIARKTGSGYPSIEDSLGYIQIDSGSQITNEMDDLLKKTKRGI